MNTFPTPQKRNNGTFAAVISLTLAVLISTALLFSRFAAFIEADTRHYIPLTRSGGFTKVVESQPGEAAAPAESVGPSRMLLVANPMLTAAWFQAYDENTVWEGETEIEIFRVSYENGEGQVTVRSQNGEKVIAPGTENTYEFALANTSRGNVEYAMTMEAYVSHEELELPVVVQVFDGEGNYYAGAEDRWVETEALNAVSAYGTLKPGYVQNYTLKWQWPFEGDDAYDTILGNLAVDEDITLTIVINTTASYTPEEGGGSPQTGDTSHIGMWVAMLLGSSACLMFLLLLLRRNGEKNEQA